MSGTGENATYLVLCDECGLAALVPFRPSTGRPTFCRACYHRFREREPGARTRVRRPKAPPRRRGARGQPFGS